MFENTVITAKTNRFAMTTDQITKKQLFHQKNEELVVYTLYGYA